MQKKIIWLAIPVVFISGCAQYGNSAYSHNRYPTTQAQTAQYVKYGTVESTRFVRLDGQGSGVGAIAGGIAGGVAGSHLGRGSGRTVGAVAGAVAGGVLGNMAEKSIKSEDALEITVRLDTGETLAVVQSVQDQFRPGERVRVLTSGSGSTRITR